jgi:PAS domain S-box-containing protein
MGNMNPETGKIRILFVEDLTTDVELACRAVKKENISFSYTVVETAKDFSRALKDFHPDIVVSDYVMPVFDGMKALTITRLHKTPIPFIVLTGSMNEQTAVKCMKAGADDYVLKENITRLPFAIKEAIEKNKVRQEKERMKQRVHDSLKEYQDLINSMNETVWIISPEGFLLDVNNRAEEVLGYNRKEILKKGLNLICKGDKNKDIKNLFNKLKHHKIIVYQTVHITKNGREIPVEISSGLIQYKGKQAVLNVARDISDRLKTEEKLQLLGRAMEQNPVAIEITDQNGITQYVNPAFTKISGYRATEVTGKTAHIFNSGNHSSSFFDMLWKTLLSGKNWTGVLRNNKKGGDVYWEQVIVSPILNDQKNTTHFVSVKEDITEKKEMYEDLVEAKEKAEESDRLKSAFLANMSHEIRTPMNGILGFTDLLNDTDLSGEQIKMYIDIIQRNGQRMLDTVNDIIEVSKIETGEISVNWQYVNVYKEIKGLYDFFLPEVQKKELRLILENRKPDIPVIISTDENKLISICTNLIKNAIKYTEKGVIKFGYHVKEGNFYFYVKDTGVGIPKERQKAIFDRFTQADICDKKALQGSGLGLSIVKSYVDMLNGQINVESEPGTGSTFSFSVPVKLHEDNNTENKTKLIHQKNMILCKRELKTLIVEDDPTADIYLSVVMRDCSKEILHTRNGKNAIDLCHKHPDIDVILMDICEVSPRC